MSPTKTPSEATLRRKAAKLGFVMRKARTRNEDSLDHGTYALIDVQTGVLALGESTGGHNGYGETLESINKFLNEQEAE